MSKQDAFKGLLANEINTAFSVPQEIETQKVKEETIKPVELPQKKEKTKQEFFNFALRLKMENYLELKAFAEQEGISLNHTINKAVKEFIKKNKEEN